MFKKLLRPLCASAVGLGVAGAASSATANPPTGWPARFAFQIDGSGHAGSYGGDWDDIDAGYLIGDPDQTPVYGQVSPLTATFGTVDLWDFVGGELHASIHPGSGGSAPTFFDVSAYPPFDGAQLVGIADGGGVVPEPASSALLIGLAAGLPALAGRRRRPGR